MDRSRICFLVVLTVVFFAAQKGFACSCIPATDEPLSNQVKQAKKKSDSVFTGKVRKITENADESYTTIEFDAINFWKGNVSKKITILTGLHDGNCRYPFEVGKTYLVYAFSGNMYSSRRSLQTHICTRTTGIADNMEDIKFLGKSTKPRQSKKR